MTREEAINILWMYDVNFEPHPAEEVMHAIDMAIEALQQPERKNGKWEIYVISMLDGEGCRCSECKFEGAPYWDFCPNCGADMRGGQE